MTTYALDLLKEICDVSERLEQDMRIDDDIAELAGMSAHWDESLAGVARLLQTARLMDSGKLAACCVCTDNLVSTHHSYWCARISSAGLRPICNSCLHRARISVEGKAVAAFSVASLSVCDCPECER